MSLLDMDHPYCCAAITDSLAMDYADRRPLCRRTRSRPFFGASIAGYSVVLLTSVEYHLVNQIFTVQS